MFLITKQLPTNLIIFTAVKIIFSPAQFFSFAKIVDSNCQNNFPSAKGIVSPDKNVLILEGNRILNPSQECPLSCHCASLWFFWQFQRQHQVQARSITQTGTIAFGRSVLILVISSPEGFFRRGTQEEFAEAHQRSGGRRKGDGAQKKWARHLCRLWFHQRSLKLFF